MASSRGLVFQLQLCTVHRIVYGDVAKYFRNYFNQVSEVDSIPLGIAQQILYPPELRLIWAKNIFFMLELHFGTGYLASSSQAETKAVLKRL